MELKNENCWAKIVCDSVSPSGERLTTVEVNFWRFILPELNTHRVFSRNYQSSRAVPVLKQLDQVIERTALPLHWGANQSGMQADEECNNPVLIPRDNDIGETKLPMKLSREEAWKYAADQMAKIARAFHDAGYHKQIVNRLIEPFVWTKGVITADQKGWDSFFALRCHPAAQPEIQALAYIIQEEMEKNEPHKLSYGAWHLPYADYPAMYSEAEDKEGLLGNAIKISTSCTAQVSYRRLDDSLEKAKKIYDMLNLPEDGVYPENPPHFSPAEHVALCMEGADGVFHLDREGNTDLSDLSGNFRCEDWLQYRKALEVGIEQDLIDGN